MIGLYAINNKFNKVSRLSYNGNNEEFTYDESDNFKSGFIGGFLDEKRHNKHQLLDVYRFRTETVGTKCSRVGSQALAETMFDDKVAQYIAVTMIGGAVSEAAGGDFLDGAIAVAMVHLFNGLMFALPFGGKIFYEIKALGYTSSTAWTGGLVAAG